MCQNHYHYYGQTSTPGCNGDNASRPAKKQRPRVTIEEVRNHMHTVFTRNRPKRVHQEILEELLTHMAHSTCCWDNGPDMPGGERMKRAIRLLKSALKKLDAPQRQRSSREDGSDDIVKDAFVISSRNGNANVFDFVPMSPARRAAALAASKRALRRAACDCNP